VKAKQRFETHARRGEKQQRVAVDERQRRLYLSRALRARKSAKAFRAMSYGREEAPPPPPHARAFTNTGLAARQKRETADSKGTGRSLP